MQNDKKISEAAKTIGTKSIETVQAAKPSPPGERLQPTTSVSAARWKRWHSKSSIILMLLGAFAVIVYLLRSGLARQYEGLGAALCAVACGGFLVWHTIHLFAEEDVLEEQLIHGTQTTVSSPRPDSAGEETNPTTPPPEPGQNFK